jgi:hypothetical protein
MLFTNGIQLCARGRDLNAIRKNTHFQNLPLIDMASSNVDTALDTVAEGGCCGRKLLKKVKIWGLLSSKP